MEVTNRPVHGGVPEGRLVPRARLEAGALSDGVVHGIRVELHEAVRVPVIPGPDTTESLPARHPMNAPKAGFWGSKKCPADEPEGHGHPKKIFKTAEIM